MVHTCDDCGETFDTLSRFRMHDCPEDSNVFTVRVRARLITEDSKRYKQVRQASRLNEDQPVFPDFDLTVKSTEAVPPQSIQQTVSESLDDIFRKEHNLWAWAETIKKSDVRATIPAGQEVTDFHQVGTIEVTDDGDIEETFITLDELKTAVQSAGT